MNEYSELEDKELHDIIEQSDMAEKFLDSPFGKIIQEAAKRITERAVMDFAKHADPSNIAAMWELKLTIRKYKYGLFDEIKILAEEGRWAYDELTERHGNLDPKTGVAQEA